MTRGRVPHDARRGFALLAALILVVSAGCGASPAGSPTASPTQTPSTSASPTPAPTPTLAPAPTPSIPADFVPRSATFVSADEGWVLGTTDCGAELCPVILHTVDGARVWARVDTPATTISTAPLPAEGTTGVTEIRFADALHGWVYGPELWATRDGGRSWDQLTLPEPLAGAPVVALEAAAGRVHAVAAAIDVPPAPGFRVASSPIDEDAWQVASVRADIGAGPVPEAQLVVAGSAGWVVSVNRVVTDGARLVDGTWSAWRPACADSLGPAVLAAWSGTGLLAVCDVGLLGDPAGEHLYVSTDGGATFVERNGALPFEDARFVAAATDSAFFVKAGSELVASFDGGDTWTTVLATGTAARAGFLDFATETQGTLIDDTGMFMTRDRGHTWHEVYF
jgi:photosystem II stability/assembly factor-like uncharacterized protein